jgi:DNA polymerase-3 subunit beta
MKATLDRSELLAAINVVSKGTSSRTTLPILSGILFSASGDSLVMSATDLEISVRAGVKASVGAEGETVAAGRLVADIVRSMPESAITLETSAPDLLTISGAQSSFKVKTLAADDFPKFPEIAEGDRVSIPAGIFTSVVRQVSKAVSRDETRPVLTGILVSLTGPRLKMVATDSYRLAVKEMDLPEAVAENSEFIVPGKALEEVSRLLGDNEAVSLGFSDNQVILEFGDVVYVSRRIEGAYPNYNQLLPAEYTSRLIVDRHELTDGVKRVALLAQHNAPLRFAMSEATLTLSASTPDVGEATEALMVQTEGNDMEIAFNPAFLIDGIASSESESVAVEMTSPVKPAVFRSAGDDSFLYLLMPVRL